MSFVHHKTLLSVNLEKYKGSNILLHYQGPQIFMRWIIST
jgi:hypothetical protein